MRQLSPAGQQIIDDLARRHGFSPDAVLVMLDAVINGNGSMAQFSHPEFGGSGQWMLGGMTMLGDMFNNYLKSRVDGLCYELAGLVASQPELLRSGSFQSQSQGRQQQAAFGGGQQQQQGGYGGSQQQDGSGPLGPVSLFVPPAPGDGGDWWGSELRWPNSTGAQNDVRYALFAQARRLAIEVNGHVTVYDTLDHQIGGFAQQQGYGGSLSFTSQYGLVDVASLPVVSIDGVPVRSPAPVAPPASAAAPVPAAAPAPAPGGGEADVFATIEKLAALHAKGILSDEEFATKKAELLGRL
ncbi:putative oligomerization/nucleic acid binding protein [Plasticicumulans lactativorans]|uniref:Putative oligomerization/nucleic acid binding protein n=1 Tax=Plasticicumulans lactativorans TaxID=1133106 RepID=A0A4V2SCW4_9GAMM|nr:SHOCT domain-containing protein [Plasticicumulans lactativorans]TCO80880.1 putative oligomerization/nucleic acid binding protein [Plasticicumulans lactativorans]